MREHARFWVLAITERDVKMAGAIEHQARAIMAARIGRRRLPEDNLHAPNESFNLDVMRRGIETTRRVLEAVAKG